MKKLLSIIVSVILLVLVSCNKNNKMESENNQPTLTADNSEQITESLKETETTYIESLGNQNFDGASYVYAFAPQGNLPLGVEELTGDVINDAIYRRDLKVGDTYNISIKYKECENSPQTGEDVANCAYAGDYFSDLYRDALSTGNAYMGTAFREGALYNMLEVPYLQLNKSWWSQLLYEQLQYNGKMFFTSGDIAVNSYMAPAATFMNHAVAGKYNINPNDIYKLVTDGIWTMDEMNKLTEGLHVDLNGDGVMNMNDDSYGVVLPTVELNATMLMCSAGVKYSEIDENGNIVINLNTEKVLDRINKIKQCYDEVKADDDWSPFRDITFKSDRALFLVHFVTSADSLRDMESDYSFLPMAKYDETQESYVSYTNPHSHSYVGIPLIQPDIERTGFVTEVLEVLSVEMVRPAIYEKTLKGQLSRNPNSTEMLDIIFDTLYIDFNALNNFGGSTGIMANILFGDSGFASEYQRIENLINEDLAAFIKLFE